MDEFFAQEEHLALAEPMLSVSVASSVVRGRVVMTSAPRCPGKPFFKLFYPHVFRAFARPRIAAPPRT